MLTNILVKYRIKTKNGMSLTLYDLGTMTTKTSHKGGINRGSTDLLG